MVKHRQLVPIVGPLTNDRQKNPMASLDDNLVLEKGTSLHIGSWIFVADGSGGFKSRTIDQSTPKIAEATSRQEIDDFIDQLEEVGHPASYFETRIQLEFGMVETKTLSELEEDLDRLLEDTKQETSMDEKILSSDYIHFAKPSLRKKKSKTSFKKTTPERSLQKAFFQTSITLMKRSNIAFS